MPVLFLTINRGAAHSGLTTKSRCMPVWILDTLRWSPVRQVLHSRYSARVFRGLSKESASFPST